MARVTMSEIAKAVGVSTATVSRVFSGAASVSPDVKARVLKAAREMNYSRTVSDGRLERVRTGNVAFLVALEADSLESDWYMATFLRGMGDYLREKNRRIIVEAHNRGQTSDVVTRYIESTDVDGIVIGGAVGSVEPIKRLVDAGIPIVQFDRYLDGEIPCVTIDNGIVVPDVVAHLAKLGHRNIGMVAGPENIPSANDKVEGFRRGLFDMGLGHCESLIVRERRYHTWVGGYAATKELFSRNPRPTAVFAADDIMAFGALKAIEELGLSVPGDCAVVGFGDLLYTQTGIALTSVSVDYGYFGQIAAKVLVDYIAGQVPSDLMITIRPRLVVRETCGGDSGTKSRG